MHLIYLKNSAKALCSISLGTAVIPRRIEKQRLCKIWGQKRCIMGNVEMCGVYKILNAHQRNSLVQGSFIEWDQLRSCYDLWLSNFNVRMKCMYRIYSINHPGHGRLLNFWTLRVGAYSRWALIRGWVLIKFSQFQKV